MYAFSFDPHKTLFIPILQMRTTEPQIQNDYLGLHSKDTPDTGLRYIYFIRCKE